MSQYADTASLDALFKKRYDASGIKKLVPDNAVLTKLIPFSKQEKLGRSFVMPVILSNSHGSTVIADGDGVVTLNNSVAMATKQAEVTDCMVVLRQAVEYSALLKAAGKGDAAFGGAMDTVVESMVSSATDIMEKLMLYGQAGMGIADTSANVDATHTVLTLTAASWADGIWAGMEGCSLDLYDGSTKKNTNAALVITAIDSDNYKITISGNSTDISTIDTFLGSGNLDIYFTGYYGKEFAGLNKIITNTGSLFGIDASAYSLWKGNTYSAGSAALTLAKILSAVAKGVVRGGLKDCIVLVHPSSFNNLNSSESSLRHYVGNEQEAINGFEALTYYSSNGKIRIVPSNICKRGEAFVFDHRKVRRVGADEISFERPGTGGKIFMEVPDKNAVETRLTFSQAVLMEQPAQAVKITNIVPS